MFLSDVQPKNPTTELAPRPLFAVLAAGMALVVCSGFLSLRLSNLDQGNSMTMTDWQVHRQQIVEQIKANPNMSPRAKAMALASFQTFGRKR